MIKKKLVSICIAALSVVFISCGNDGKFKIAKGNVGKVTTKTAIQDLENIFKNDSIVKNLSEGSLGDNYFQDDDEYLIFEKGGKHLLTIIPREQLDSTSTIKSIQIFDERYRTENGLSLSSSFLDINARTKINKVETSFSSATLFIDELNATIAIDKEELGLREFSTQKVSTAQIPDLAKIKSFIVWFN
jgi:hypothetical protein